VRRRAVDVEVIILDVLPVIRLAIGQPEQTLLENGITFVPQGDGETEALFVVRDAAQAVLAPPVRART